MAVITVKKGTVEYLQAENIPVTHCFTTRVGGVSSGDAAGLNIGAHREECFENVRRNYAILGDALGFDPSRLVLANQVHGNAVLAVTAADARGLDHLDYPECDALITNDPGVGLVIFTADCTPVLLFDPVTGAVGAAHAGWRGTAAKIAAKTVEAMTRHYGCRPENIRAAIGPNIAQCCFQTDADVPAAMQAAYGADAGRFIRQDGSKYYVNLKALNSLSLQQAGVDSIEISDDCTACMPQRYWSHRYTGGQRGSQGALILCEEVHK